MDVLVFHLNAQRYGLPVADVQEVVRAVAVAPLPKAPRIVEGVIDVRGRLVPTLDVRARFRMGAKPLHPSDFLVLARVGGQLLALRVDAVPELVRLAEADVETLDQLVLGAEYIAGVGKLPDGLVLIHDLRTFLSHAEAAELSQALDISPPSPEPGAP